MNHEYELTCNDPNADCVVDIEAEPGDEIWVWKDGG